jgi:hypothetical protein
MRPSGLTAVGAPPSNVASCCGWAGRATFHTVSVPSSSKPVALTRMRRSGENTSAVTPAWSPGDQWLSCQT